MKEKLTFGILFFFIANIVFAQQTELLTNPDFNSGTDGWWAYGADITTQYGEVYFDINNAGLNPWDIQLGQGNLILQQGYKYTLCWRAKRENGSLSFNVGLGEAPYTLYFSDKPSGFQNEWMENCIEYFHTDENVENVALTIDMGESDANASFDYIYLKEEPDNQSEITFRVDMQHETISHDGVFIAGSFNGWNPVPMQSSGSVYSSSVKLFKGETVTYKFLNGSEWENFNGNCTSGNNNDRVLLVPELDQLLETVCYNSCTNCIDSTILFTNPGAGPVSFYGEMQVNGNRIYGERTGTPVQIKGISLFWSIWGGEKFWNSGAVNALVDEWDIELIRASMSVEDNHGWDYGFLHPNGRDKQLSFVDKVVKAAIARDIYVIIDYHSHYADEHPEAAVEFFSYVAQKYGEYDNVIFEIYNEPIQPNWPTIKAYAGEVIEAIRQYSDNLVVVGTEAYSQWVHHASLSPLNDENTAYVFHFYADHTENNRQIVRDALNNGVALFATEWGNIFASGENEGYTSEATFRNSDNWHELMDEHYISSANWCVFVDRHQHASGLFYHEEGMQGNISFTGENWDDTSTWTASAHYVYNMLKEQAARAPWRKAEKQGYSITYHFNGGYNGANPAFYSYNLDEALKLREAIKEGFRFEGWYTNHEFTGNTLEEIKPGSTGDLELFAKWSKLDSIELLNNPQFSLGTYAWYHWGDNDSVSVDDEKITIHELIDDSGELWSYTLFNTAKITLKKDHRYTLAWKARRASGVIGFIVRTMNPYLAYFFDYPTFDGVWQENTLVYDHTDETVDDAELAIQIGGYTSDATFDYVSLIETKIPAPVEYSVTATAEPLAGGTILGVGSYEEGSHVELIATANDGYQFESWMVDESEVSTNTEYSFTVTEDISITAVFGAEPLEYTVTATAEPQEGGTISGEGKYVEGEQAVVIVTPNEGFQFVEWRVDGNIISTAVEYSFAVTQNTSLIAILEEGNALSEYNDKSSIRVFPNPFDRFIEVSGLPVNEKLWIGVFSRNGNLVQEQTTYKHSDVRVNMVHINIGVYFVKIEGSVTNEIVKVVKICE